MSFPETISPINLNLGLMLLTGLIFGLVFSRLGLPRVAAYVIAGIVFSRDALGRYMDIGIGSWAEPLTLSALGIIAYLIGGSITINQLKRIGKIIISSALFESLCATAFVFIAFIMLFRDIAGVSILQLALAFAAIAATTAPAGTVAVLHQYRARGLFASTLLGVVALDDAIGIILFSLMAVVTVSESLTVSLGTALFKIIGAVMLGAASGILLTFFSKWIREHELRLPVIIGGILLVIGLSELWNVSPLLAAMSMGFFTRLFVRASADRLFTPIDRFEELVFIVFFTLAGAHFETHVFLHNINIIIIYFFARIAGKVTGASLGAWISGAPKPVVRWLGFGLIPQAGVAVGLAITLSHQPAFQEVSSLIVNVILATTLLYEVLGPLCVRLALDKVGELGIKRRRRIE